MIKSMFRELGRTTPVTGGFVRRMDYPIQVSGYEVPANTFVICFPGQQYTLQKDTLWDDSKEFNPRRFFSVQFSFFGWETIILQEDDFFSFFFDVHVLNLIEFD